MKRSFIKPAKKNPKFWEIETNGKSYVVTEGQTGGDSNTTSKEFPSETKCLMAVATLVERIREKGYMETLPEYSEWVGTKREYAIWRNTEAVEFVIKTLKENSKATGAYDVSQQTADEVLDEISAQAKDLEICLETDIVRLRMMALKKEPYWIEIFFKENDPWSKTGARTPYWSLSCKTVYFATNAQFKQLIIDYFNQNGKGKWLDKNQQAESSIEQDLKQIKEQKDQENYHKNLKSIVNSEYARPKIRLALALSMKTIQHTWHYSTNEQAEKDIIPMIFECAKSKIKNDYDDTLAKTWCMLYNQQQPLPLARLKEAFEDLKQNREISTDRLYKDLIFEAWENNPDFLKKMEIDPSVVREHI